MQRENNKEWWHQQETSKSSSRSSYPPPYGHNWDDIGRYNVSILKKSFKNKEKCLITSFFYTDVCLEEPFKKIEDIISNQRKNREPVRTKNGRNPR